MGGVDICRENKAVCKEQVSEFVRKRIFKKEETKKKKIIRINFKEKN